MANSGLANLIGPALEKVCDAASGRKYATLRQEAAVSPPPCCVELSLVLLPAHGA